MPDPSSSDRIAAMKDWAGEDPHQLPYVSKSRVVKWLKCQSKFRYRYVEGIRGPETQPMVRGSIVHEAYEDYYENLTDYVNEHGEVPSHPWELLPSSSLWGDFTEPFISAFLAFEMRRYEYVEHPRRAIPVAVEAEGWIEKPLGMDDDLRETNADVEEANAMGFADVIYRADSLPEDVYESDEGNVVCDFKTGKVAAEKYRDEGIYPELAYYHMVFGDEHDLSGAMVFYPRGGLAGESLSLTVDELEPHKDTVREAMTELQLATARGDPDGFEVDEQPLCKWGEGEDAECPYYDECASTWGEPGRNPVVFAEMVERNAPTEEIVETLDMENGSSINYWKYKLGL